MNHHEILRSMRATRTCAFALTWVVAGLAHASATYTFHSPILDNDGVGDTASFTIALTYASPLSDGVYYYAGESQIPVGFSYLATDGYTTLKSNHDLVEIPFGITVSSGLISDYSIYVFDLSSAADPYYGYNFFYAGSETQLQDVNDPQIVGLEYSGHHIPIASGGQGYWTYPALSSVPEPSTYGLLVAGLGLLGFQIKRKSSR